MRYYPEGFFLARAEFSDNNNNQTVDFGDSLEVFFSRPAKMADVDVFDFATMQPEKGLGSAIIKHSPRGPSLQIIFAPPMAPKIKLGETMLVPRPTRDSVIDFSQPPQRLDTKGVIIQRRK
jgi:hypothetical protein